MSVCFPSIQKTFFPLKITPKFHQSPPVSASGPSHQIQSGPVQFLWSNLVQSLSEPGHSVWADTGSVGSNGSDSLCSRWTLVCLWSSPLMWLKLRPTPEFKASPGAFCFTWITTNCPPAVNFPKFFFFFSSSPAVKFAQTLDQSNWRLAGVAGTDWFRFQSALWHKAAHREKWLKCDGFKCGLNLLPTCQSSVV